LISEDSLGGLEAIHDRHVAIHKNQFYRVFTFVHFVHLYVLLIGLFSVVGLNEVMGCVNLVHLLKDISQDIHIKEDVIDDENPGTSHLRSVDNRGSAVYKGAINTNLIKSLTFITYLVSG
jgi:hypothetical protein